MKRQSGVMTHGCLTAPSPKNGVCYTLHTHAKLASLWSGHVQRNNPKPNLLHDCLSDGLICQDRSHMRRTCKDLHARLASACAGGTQHGIEGLTLGDALTSDSSAGRSINMHALLLRSGFVANGPGARLAQHGPYPCCGSRVIQRLRNTFHTTAACDTLHPL